MTPPPDTEGYLEGAYLTGEYMTGHFAAPIGMQANMFSKAPLGMQATMVHQKMLGMQATMVIYNDRNLRILMDFASRGTPDLLGLNWTASSIVAGAPDWGVKNLNTDIVEQYYRSEDAVTTITLTCDTGVPQGVPINTIALLGHNLTSSAIVQVQGSQDGTFSPPDITFNMQTTVQDMYYVAPTLPGANGQNRYWRFIIQDADNPDTFIRIGCLIFGAALIFTVKDTYIQPLKFGYRHFKDAMETEGFTTVSNDRALKKLLSLNFQALNRRNNNYRILERVMTEARTSLKCLIMPLPRFPTRHTVFAKLVELPQDINIIANEILGSDNNPTDVVELIDLGLAWDESE